ncbi:MAG: hypothetical protein EXQ90_08585 [Rhodospirillales bacterium]|nr:hypothetical protein [Rhodospirillales bacterium]
MIRNLLMAGAAVLTVVACAAAGWEHPTVPRDRWITDERECAREADLEVERMTRGDRLSQGDLTAGRTSYEQGMARVELGRIQRTEMTRCMTARGYVRGSASTR